MSLMFSPGLSSAGRGAVGASAISYKNIAISPLDYDQKSRSVFKTAAEKPSSSRWQHLYILPVLLLEFLALALTRAVLPALLLQQYGNRVYLVLGFADCVRGLLAFVACPIFGKVSDVVGRRICLLVTVLGTCAPVCSLAFFSWDRGYAKTMVTNGTDSIRMRGLLSNDYVHSSNQSSPYHLSTIESDESVSQAGLWVSRSDDITGSISGNTTADGVTIATTTFVHSHAVTVFVVLLALSGIFSSTFTLVFAYISDTVRQQDERVSAYGLALAMFGLSFTIGPMAGGYLAQYNTQYVFLTSLLLTIVDLLYIYLILPESRDLEVISSSADGRFSSANSLISMDHKFSWNPWETIRIIAVDPFLRKVGEVSFLYYTALWAIISTLSLYAVQRFHLSPERLGELMSALGLCTMVAEAVLVRIMVPLLGEKQAMKVGLVSFAMQCIVLGFAYEGWHLFVCAIFSLLGNLVYPSLSSLASGNVEPDAVGEALGAINGIKALTEGIGPLVFGSLMTLSEHSALPGWPYLLAAVFAALAYKAADELPDSDDDDYIHELQRKSRRGSSRYMFVGRQLHNATRRIEPDGEYEDLLHELSEIDESDDDYHVELPNR